MPQRGTVFDASAQHGFYFWASICAFSNDFHHSFRRLSLEQIWVDVAVNLHLVRGTPLDDGQLLYENFRARTRVQLQFFNSFATTSYQLSTIRSVANIILRRPLS